MPIAKVIINGFEYEVDVDNNHDRDRARNLVRTIEFLTDKSLMDINVEICVWASCSWAWKRVRIGGLIIGKKVSLSNRRGTLKNIIQFIFHRDNLGNISRYGHNGPGIIGEYTSDITVPSKDKRLIALIDDVSVMCKDMVGPIEAELAKYSDHDKYIKEFHDSRGKKFLGKYISELADSMVGADRRTKSTELALGRKRLELGGSGNRGDDLDVDFIRKIMANPNRAHAIATWCGNEKKSSFPYTDEDLEDAISMYRVKTVTDK